MVRESIAVVKSSLSNLQIRKRERRYLKALCESGTFCRLTDIVRRSGMSMRTVKRARKDLLLRGLIRLIRRSIYDLGHTAERCQKLGSKVAPLPRARTRKVVNTPVRNIKSSTKNINRDFDAFGSMADGEREYVTAIRKYFRERKHTKYSWARYDTDTALAWHRNGVSLELAQRAIDYGIANKFERYSNTSRINSLRYFEASVVELSKENRVNQALGGGFWFEFCLWLDKLLKRRYELEEDFGGFTYAYGG